MRPGVPRPRARHVRAAGPSQRLRLSRRAADRALRHRRLDAGLSDGRAVRSHPRRLRRPVRGGQGPVAAAAGARRRRRRRRRLLPRPADRTTPSAPSIGCWPPARKCAACKQPFDSRRQAASRRARSSFPHSRRRLPLLEKIAAELGTPFVGSPVAPGNEAVALKPVRIGLWDRYGGSMPSGWTRWLLERFEFPFQVVFPPELDKGGLREKFDVLIFVDGAIPWPRLVERRARRTRRRDRRRSATRRRPHCRCQRAEHPRRVPRPPRQRHRDEDRAAAASSSSKAAARS